MSVKHNKSGDTNSQNIIFMCLNFQPQFNSYICLLLKIKPNKQSEKLCISILLENVISTSPVLTSIFVNQYN